MKLAEKIIGMHESTSIGKEHLGRTLYKVFKDNPDVAVIIGNDDWFKPDVMTAYKIGKGLEHPDAKTFGNPWFGKLVGETRTAIKAKSVTKAISNLKKMAKDPSSVMWAEAQTKASDPWVANKSQVEIATPDLKVHIVSFYVLSKSRFGDTISGSGGLTRAKLIELISTGDIKLPVKLGVISVDVIDLPHVNW